MNPQLPAYKAGALPVELVRHGVVDGDRTRALLDHNQALFRLSYGHHGPANPLVRPAWVRRGCRDSLCAMTLSDRQLQALENLRHDDGESMSLSIARFRFSGHTVEECRRAYASLAGLGLARTLSTGSFSLNASPGNRMLLDYEITDLGLEALRELGSA